MSNVTSANASCADCEDGLRGRRLDAFARAAAAIALEGPLQVVLDHLAEEVLIASQANACGIALVSRLGDSVELFGAAGYPEGYVDHINEAIALRAPLVSLEAYRARVNITRDVARTLAGDPRFKPFVQMTEIAGWTTLVTIPLELRGERVGVLTALYTDSRQPDSSDTTFLTAMADHGAIAINTARLLAETRDKVAQEERNRMAREIHDAVSQSLFSMKMRTKALQIAAERTEDSTGKLRPGLAAMEGTVDRAVEDMRALIMHLRPTDLRDNDLANAIKRYAEAVSDRDAIFVEVRLSGEMPNFDRDTEVKIYQIAREAIANSVDHAKASRLAVRLSPDWRNGVGHLVLEIVDDGVGFDVSAERPGHIGIAAMRERASEIGADLMLTSVPTGTTVRLEVVMPTVSLTEPSGAHA
ncbi:GAF domain-containing sensor histidine kinase [Gordonia sp. PKS22-38]|uniref:GAF domain-containing sensor histidine kinase n=1 Tax=Gordonia prachuapensis TaxID=3115651 RepID=A0ABU7MUL6_9ACTN|nr:GAF domain-containing sensor histidine kinase [Gordonia sp. PKS22-38]